jgi:hypothetical protein
MSKNNFGLKYESLYLFKIHFEMKNWLVVLWVLNFVLLSAQTVYKTPSGSRYHTANCSVVKNVSQKISKADAKKQGLSACKICRPETAISPGTTGNKGSGIGSSETSGSLNKSVQCSAYTKKGNRCKRMTKNINGYCFQHEP